MAEVVVGGGGGERGCRNLDFVITLKSLPWKPTKTAPALEPIFHCT